MKSNVSAWILAMRPKTLWAGICPVVIGSLLALPNGGIHWASFYGAMFSAICIQIGTNFANDYFDFEKGADTKDRLGPQRATQSGLVTPDQMKLAFKIAFALAFIAGLLLVLRGGTPILAIGIASIICGYWYTGGPYPLAYIGLGDLFVLIFFGPVAVAGTYYLHQLEWSWTAIIMGFSPGLISVALLVVNNIRDRVQDKIANKRTIIVRFGHTFGKWLYAACLTIAVAIPIGLGYLGLAPKTSLIVGLGWLFLGLPAIRTVFKEDGPILNGVLARTGLFLLVFTLLLGTAYLYGA